MIFTIKKNDQVHIPMNNMRPLSYLKKMGVQKNQEWVAISKEIWQYFSKRKITITNKYLLGSMKRQSMNPVKQGIPANED